MDIRYVADLARIALTEDEIRRYGAELDAILSYVAQLSELNVDGIEPTAQALPRTNVMRADETAPGLDRAAVLANAPETVADAYIRVPPVLEEEDA
jgi:aspartyl-tRNA(Asn)/glutamyl-tRNA(Gln) amidotransferase subunit C